MRVNILKYILVYIASFTWGIIASLLGILVLIFSLFSKPRFETFNGCLVIILGDNWGTFTLGPFIFSAASIDKHLFIHEVGHCLQNVLFGPLYIPLMLIPSIIRTKLRKIKTYNNKRVFVLVLFLCCVLISVMFSTLGFFVLSSLMKVFNCITLYMIPLFIWLLACELPKYENEKYNFVLHTDTILEGFASLLGIKYCS